MLVHVCTAKWILRFELEFVSQLLFTLSVLFLPLMILLLPIEPQILRKWWELTNEALTDSRRDAILAVIEGYRKDGVSEEDIRAVVGEKNYTPPAA